MSDSTEAVHADLAKANLLRLRGEYADAEALCVRVLAADPENGDAHVLLGDIALDQDRPEQAVEHYELALPTDPTNTELSRKLATAQSLKERRQRASSIDQLGLGGRERFPWATVGLAALALTSLAVSIGYGWRITHQTTGRHDALPPIVASADTIAPAPAAPKTAVESPSTDPAATPDSTKPKADSGSPASSNSSPTGMTSDDRTMLQMVQAQSQGGVHVLGILQDPRTKAVIVSYRVAAGDDIRRIGAEIGKTILDQFGDAQAVTLRAIRDDRLIYVADMPRTAYADTLTDAWQHANPSPDAWIAHSISGEWPYRSTDAPENGNKTP